MIQSKHKLIILTPIYEDLAASTRLFKEIKSQFKNNVFVIAVDDGSLKEPIEISSFKKIKLDGAIIKLKRNVGHQKAIAIGLDYFSKHTVLKVPVVIMDSDGEDSPSTIRELLKYLKDPTVDVVVAKRMARVETFRFKFFYAIYKGFFRLMTGRKINFGNFMALKYDSIERLVFMRELSIHIAATVLASKLRIEVFPLSRGQRFAGKSKMNFVGLVLHGFRALMVFAEDVLIRVGIICVLIAVLSFFGLILASTLKIIGIATPGWFSSVFGILILIILQTGLLALTALLLTGITRNDSAEAPHYYENYIRKVTFSAKLRNAR
jgi:glycosyltransferase involved in cell wall biosynthesis